MKNFYILLIFIFSSVYGMASTPQQTDDPMLQKNLLNQSFLTIESYRHPDHEMITVLQKEDQFIQRRHQWTQKLLSLDKATHNRHKKAPQKTYAQSMIKEINRDLQHLEKQKRFLKMKKELINKIQLSQYIQDIPMLAQNFATHVLRYNDEWDVVEQKAYPFNEKDQTTRSLFFQFEAVQFYLIHPMIFTDPTAQEMENFKAIVNGIEIPQTSRFHLRMKWAKLGTNSNYTNPPYDFLRQTIFEKFNQHFHQTKPSQKMIEEYSMYFEYLPISITSSETFAYIFKKFVPVSVLPSDDDDEALYDTNDHNIRQMHRIILRLIFGPETNLTHHQKALEHMEQLHKAVLKHSSLMNFEQYFTFTPNGKYSVPHSQPVPNLRPLKTKSLKMSVTFLTREWRRRLEIFKNIWNILKMMAMHLSKN